MYSLPKKQCTKFSNEKSSFFFTVKPSDNLHAGTYGLYKYTCKVKKNRGEMATLNYKHFATPGGSYHRAH